jgi:epsilon-lactone hydrolase
VGDDEVLLADSVSLVERALVSGVDVALEVWEGMPHGFLGSVGRMDASDRALEAIGLFLSSKLVG